MSEHERMMELAELREPARRPKSMVWASNGSRRKCEGCTACVLFLRFSSAVVPRLLCDGSGWQPVWP